MAIVRGPLVKIRISLLDRPLPPGPTASGEMGRGIAQSEGGALSPRPASCWLSYLAAQGLSFLICLRGNQGDFYTTGLKGGPG